MSGRDPITADDVRGAHLRAGLFLDGDEYCNQWVCVEYPELRKIATGPRRRNSKATHCVTYRVGTENVPKDEDGKTSADAIAAALNAYRAGLAPRCET
jgi:hypothetical protein